MEEVKKRNPDYTASAVNLTNPESVGRLLHLLLAGQSQLIVARQRAQEYIPEQLKDEIANTEKTIAALDKEIREAIKHDGSFQDVEHGLYALQQRRVSVSYNAQQLRDYHPHEAALVVEEIVNPLKIAGLIKGGLLDADILKKEGVTKESVSLAYIIKG